MSEVGQEKNFEIIISKNLKPNNQCKEIIKYVNGLLEFIGKTFQDKSEKSFLHCVI